MTIISEQEIIKQLKTDDKTAMQLLFERHYQSVCNRIFKLIKDKATVEDIAQIIFIKIWEKRHKLQIQTSLGAYLHRMAFNETISYIRKHKKHMHEEITVQMSPSIDSSEQQLLDTELNKHITKAINKLPNRCRLIFQLSRFEELTYKEIAAKLDISIKTVENQMGKALKLMRSNMKPYLSRE